MKQIMSYSGRTLDLEFTKSICDKFTPSQLYIHTRFYKGELLIMLFRNILDERQTDISLKFDHNPSQTELREILRERGILV